MKEKIQHMIIQWPCHHLEKEGQQAATVPSLPLIDA